MLKKKKSFIFICFIILLLICYFFPYTGDDWAWGTSIGLGRFQNLFANYNGRYMGNLVVLLLTRSRTLRALVICVSLVVYVFLIYKFLKSEKNQKSLIYILAILLLLIPFNIITQSIAWTSGFANYVIPLELILIYLIYNKEYFKLEIPSDSKKLQYLFLILGFLSSLFIEHITIYNLILSAFVLFLGYVLKKKVVKQNLFYFLGALIGSVIMFSNSAYLDVLNATDSYRTVKMANFVTNIISTYFKDISNNLVNNNFIIIIVISLCIIYTILKKIRDKNFKSKRIINIYMYSSLVLLTFYNLFILINKLYTDLFSLLFGRFSIYVEGILSALFLINILFYIIFIAEDVIKKRRMLFEFFSICLITLPLFVVTPIGPRCFFPVYIFWVILSCEFIELMPFKFNNLFVLKTIILSMLFFYFCFYFRVFYVDIVREVYIKNEFNNNEVLCLPKLPFEEYIWYANPTDETFKYRFKLFYNISDKTDIKFIDYYLWKDQCK